MLTREQILAADDLPYEDVDVPEWGGTVRIRTMTGAERDAWESTLVGKKGKANLENLRARLIAFCAVGEDGKRLFKFEDAEALGKKSAAALERAVKVAQRLNRLTETELEEAVKN